MFEKIKFNLKKFREWTKRKEPDGTPLWKALFFQGRIPWRYKVIIKNNRFNGLIKKIRHKYYVNNFDIKKESSFSPKPNIIIIMMDTVRAKDLPMYGGRAKMPFLSKFANKTRIYTQAYSVANWTLPSHGSLFTGVYPNKHGLDGWDKQLNKSYKTLAERLKEEGYSTTFYTENPFLCEKYDIIRGFDKYHYVDKDIGVDTKIDTKYLKKNKPFLLFVNFMTAHFPYRINLSFLNKMSRKEANELLFRSDYFGVRKIKNNEDYLKIKKKWNKVYLSTLEYLDFQLSNVFNKLKKKDLLKNSLVIMTSDHGEQIFDNEKITKQRDFVLGHYCCYNSTIKIPLIIKHLDNNISKEYTNLISNLDVMPTIFQELGFKIKDKLDGHSIFDYQRDFVVCLNPNEGDALIKGNYKLIDHHNKTELFNLKEDPLEKNPIANKQLESDLLQKLKEINKDYDISFNKKMSKSDELQMKEKLKELGYI
ncbi:sulfatase-like hydrolase/transferase [Candidatus Pacearchaeota archaeon]|nr:sulfatase-like hydrolase/transferase [Candidatus Pacearchaeota archaeon]